MRRRGRRGRRGGSRRRKERRRVVPRGRGGRFVRRKGIVVRIEEQAWNKKINIKS